MAHKKEVKEGIERELTALRERVSELEKKLQNQTEIEREKAAVEHSLRERVKELNCLYEVAELIELNGNSFEKVLQGVANLIPSSWQYPEITTGRIIFDDQEFCTPGFKPSKWRQTADIYVKNEKLGVIEVFYLEEKPESHEGPFLKEERFLLEAIAERVGNTVEHRQSEEALKRIEWLLEARSENVDQIQHSIPSYGDLTQLNTCRVVLDAVGKDVLADIVNDYLSFLDTSAAVYEKNGDYALGIFTSSWCRFLDRASRSLCETDDSKKALQSGKWLCHESCWSDASVTSIEKDQPIDIECHGGLHIYAVPIRVGDEVVGSINLGYGDPPSNPQKLKEIADKYNVSVDELLKYADAFESRPDFMVKISKQHLLSSARLIGEIIKRKQIEEQLIATLKEKEVLLSEVHHRVKNNMQVIISLLRVQSDYVTDKKYFDMLKDSQNRIKSMAYIHENLYLSKNFANIDFEEYIKILTDDLLRSYHVNPDKIKVDIEVKDVSLRLDHAIPCGLIINELVSNSLKYAFPEDRKGEIMIAFGSINENEIELIVSDDGIGLPEDLDVRNAESMGMQLIMMLAEYQLKGKLEVNRTRGTKYHIQLKKR